MSTWIESIDDKLLRTFAKHTSVGILISKTDGSIVWANEAFCEWSGYTLAELRVIGWRKLSIDEESLQADIEQAKSLEVYSLRYTVQKRYIPKNGAPVWGGLSVLRYPALGDMEFALCTWEPLRNGTAAAFTASFQHIDKMTSELKELNKNISHLTTQSVEDRALLAASNLIRKYPRATWVLVLAALTVFGANNLVQLLTSLSIVPSTIQRVQQSGQ